MSLENIAISLSCKLLDELRIVLFQHKFKQNTIITNTKNIKNFIYIFESI